MEHWSPEGIYYQRVYITTMVQNYPCNLTWQWHGNDSHVAGRLESLEDVQISTMSMCWMVVVITGKSLVLCNWCTGWCLCHENYENNANIEMDLSESIGYTKHWFKKMMVYHFTIFHLVTCCQFGGWLPRVITFISHAVRLYHIPLYPMNIT